MTNHLTTITRVEDQIVASCPEHGTVGTKHLHSRRGFKAVIAEACAHDDLVHGVRRDERQYRRALVAEAQEFRAGGR